MKIESLEGIYVANVLSSKVAQQILEQEAESEGSSEKNSRSSSKETQKEMMTKKLINQNIKTYITFNKGSTWKPLEPPKFDSDGQAIQCNVKDGCALHLFLSRGTTVPFYSHKNAHGIIMANGNVGTRLMHINSELNMYFSRDGGLNWNEVTQGPQVYDIGDHGGILIRSSLDETAKNNNAVLMYSWDEGKHWKKIPVKGMNMSIVNVFTEPDSSTQHFLLQADLERKDKHGNKVYKSVLANLNFENLNARKCVGEEKPDTPDSDFETWTPNDGRAGQTCLLGQKYEYVRRKRDAECYNGIRFERVAFVENCTCTEEDYECDFGFMRKLKGTNVPCTAITNISYSPPDDCPSGTTYTVTSGYRKIASDYCIGGIRHDPIILPCPSKGLAGSSSLLILVLLGIIVVLLVVISYAYKNIEAIKAKLKFAFKKTDNKTEVEFRDIRYGKIAGSMTETPEDDIVLRSTKKDED